MKIGRQYVPVAQANVDYVTSDVYDGVARKDARFVIIELVE